MDERKQKDQGAPPAQPKASHTPGPWGVAFQDSPLRVLAQDQRRTIICTIEGAASNPTCEADAVLIAAAPALVAALEGLLRAWDDDPTWPEVLAAKWALGLAGRLP